MAWTGTYIYIYIIYVHVYLFNSVSKGWTADRTVEPHHREDSGTGEGAARRRLFTLNDTASLS